MTSSRLLGPSRMGTNVGVQVRTTLCLFRFQFRRLKGQMRIDQDGAGEGDKRAERWEVGKGACVVV